MRDVTIETANLNDLPALCRLRAEFQGHALEWEPRITAYMIGQQTPAFGLEDRVVLVAVTADNDVVGFIAGHLTTRFHTGGEVHWLNVQANQRGRRVADQLLAALFDWFAKRGVEKVCVEVAPSNDSARKVFERHGAETIGPLWMVFPSIDPKSR